jgi:hypothetical protein
VLDYLRDRPQCISGVPPPRRSQLYTQFEEALQRYSLALPPLHSPPLLTLAVGWGDSTIGLGLWQEARRAANKGQGGKG